VTEIGDSSFEYCKKLESVKLSESLRYINTGAFRYCENLRDIVIPGNVSKICYGAFDGCSNLTIVKIPKSVKAIHSGAFHNCSKLTNIYYAGSRFDWKKIKIDIRNEKFTGGGLFSSVKRAKIHFNCE
jgi:hypothetical protein